MPGVGSVSAAALFVEIGRGRPNAVKRLDLLLETHSKEDDWVAYLAGGCGIDLALWQGDLDRARELTQRTLTMLDVADETWELSSIWPAALGLAAAAERAQRARLARDDAAVADARVMGQALIERCHLTQREARSAGRQIGPEAIAWLARAEAEWARIEGNTDPNSWAITADAFSYGYVYEEARSRWRLGEALLEHGRRDEAAEQVQAAYATALRLGADPLREQIEALARRGRLDIGAALVASRGAAGLTPREREVLRLVAAGRSNQQIADALFISRKTASVHVSHILTKLGVDTRVEAAAFAHRQGLDGPAELEEDTTR
jgi:DNA-binding CsgD family transcriptional regulator